MTSDKVENIYVHAGCPEKGRLSDLWAFNVNTRTWTELPTAPSPARGGASLTFYNKKLYRMNGFDGQKELGGVIDVYDIVTRTWSTLQFIPDGVEGPTPRSVGALLAIEINNEAHLVTLFGEQDPSSLGHAGAGKMLGDVWAFDLKNNKWSLVEPSGDRPAPRGWFSADVVQDAQGKQGIIFHGGLAEDNSRLGDVWRLTFA
jgi:N-acetylneuraminic acid mutarotase